jgi:hypothetical protein
MARTVPCVTAMRRPLYLNFFGVYPGPRGRADAELPYNAPFAAFYGLPC